MNAGIYYLVVYSYFSLVHIYCSLVWIYKLAVQVFLSVIRIYFLMVQMHYSMVQIYFWVVWIPLGGTSVGFPESWPFKKYLFQVSYSHFLNARFSTFSL